MMTSGFRRFVDWVTRSTTWLKKRQKINPTIDPVCVNIGSGFSVAKDWINIDCSLNALFSKLPRFLLKKLYRFSTAKKWYPRDEFVGILKSHIFIAHRAEYGIPLPDDSIDYIYSSHLIEHLHKEDTQNLLKEAYRSLKEGGRIRLCTPDLEYVIRLYQSGKKEKALGHFFASSNAGHFSRHQYLYDFNMLKSALECVGFVDVEKHSHRKGKVPDIEKLDNRPEQTLFVEARKKRKL